MDNDPHFIVRVKGLADSVCFDVMGNEGDVYNLVKDEISGLCKICCHDSLPKKKNNEKDKKLKDLYQGLYYPLSIDHILVV